jgi:hypothetical protein
MILLYVVFFRLGERRLERVPVWNCEAKKVPRSLSQIGLGAPLSGSGQSQPVRLTAPVPHECSHPKRPASLPKPSFDPFFSRWIFEKQAIPTQVCVLFGQIVI